MSQGEALWEIFYLNFEDNSLTINVAGVFSLFFFKSIFGD